MCVDHFILHFNANQCQFNIHAGQNCQNLAPLKLKFFFKAGKDGLHPDSIWFHMVLAIVSKNPQQGKRKPISGLYVSLGSLPLSIARFKRREQMVLKRIPPGP